MNDVSFELRRGECLGLIGRNGAGKTTLLKMLNGLIKPDLGRIEMHGRVGALIALGAGFNPILSGRENIYVNASILGLSKREIDEKFEEIVDFAEIGDFIDSPVQSYSSGMQVRLGFSVATALSPDVLILDEVLAVGDIRFREKCLHRIFNLLKTCAVLFVSHEHSQVQRICTQAMLLSNGHCIYTGGVAESYRHYNSIGSEVDKESRELITTCFDPLYDIRMSLQSKVIESGKPLVIFANLSLHAPTTVDHCAVLIRDNTALPVAHTSKTFAPIHVLHNDTIKIEIPRLELQQGTFVVDIVISGSSGRAPLARCIGGLNVKVQNEVITSCNYQPHVNISRSDEFSN